MNYLFGIFSNKKQGLVVIFFFYTLFHIFFLDLPPNGSHVWRQCHTSTVARNYVEESMNLFQPRIDARGNSNGVTGMQFPSFEYTVALLAQVVGYSDGLNRVVALLYFAVGIWYFYKLLSFFFKDNTVAFLGTWAFTFSPILYYHAVTALPDIVALSASIAGLYYFLVWSEKKNHSALLLSLLFTTLAGLTKLQYLAIGLPIAVVVIFSFIEKKYSFSNVIFLLLFGLLSVGLSLAWYAYALHLIEVSGLTDFGISFKPAHSLAKGLDILWKNLYTHFTEQLISIPNLIPFGFAFYIMAKEKNVSKKVLWMFGVWAAGLFVYHLIELHQMEEHMYYMFPYLPLVFLITTQGYKLLLQKQHYTLILLLVISLPLVAFAGTWHNFLKHNDALPKDFYNETQRQALDDLIPDHSLCMVGPDQSRCIYHYFTHTKGWTFRNKEEFTETWFQTVRKSNADYLIWTKNNPLPGFVLPYVTKLNYKGTDLEIYSFNVKK